MIPKIKAQKTRLSNYLIKELGAEVKKAITTNSEYFTLGDIEIRISDHIGHYDQNKINILLPYNDPNCFIIENNSVINILHSLKEVKSFLNSLLFVPKFYFETENKIKELRESIDNLNKKIHTLKLENKEINKSLFEKTLECEKLVSELSNINNVLNRNNIIDNVLINNGKIYPLKEFPNNFKHKIKNVIENSSKLNKVSVSSNL